MKWEILIILGFVVQGSVDTRDLPILYYAASSTFTINSSIIENSIYVENAATNQIKSSIYLRKVNIKKCWHKNLGLQSVRAEEAEVMESSEPVCSDTANVRDG